MTIRNHPRSYRHHRSLLLVATLCAVAASAAISDTPKWTATGPDGGNITVVAVAPSDSQILYAGLDRGGVYRSLDGGQHWKWITEGNFDLNNYGISAFQIDPNDPLAVAVRTSGTHWLATRDRGLSWSDMSFEGDPSVLDVPFQLLKTGGAKLRADPFDPRVLYAGTDIGVLKSEDGGTTWSDTTLTGIGKGIGSISILQTKPSTVLIGLKTWSIPSRVARSNDGGRTWAYSESWPCRYGLDDTWYGQSALRPDPFDPRIVYAFNGCGLLRSSDGGRCWDLVPTWPHDTRINSLVFDPARFGSLWVGTSRGVFHSPDSGITWTSMNRQLSSSHVKAVLAGPAPKTVFAVLDFAEIWRSTDAATTWTVSKWPASRGANRFHLSVFPGIHADPRFPDKLYAETTAGIARSDDGGTSWVLLSPVPGSQLASPPLPSPDQKVVFRTVHASEDETTLERSVDGGITWSSVFTVEGSTGLILRFDPHDFSSAFLKPLVRNGEVENDAWRSKDGGITWDEVDAESASLMLPVFDAKIRGSLYAIKPFNGVWGSTDSGDNWELRGFPNQSLRMLVSHPQASGVLYAASDVQVLWSADGARTWQRLDEGLPQGIAITSLAIDPDGGTLYVGTVGRGVHVLCLTKAGSPR